MLDSLCPFPSVLKIIKILENSLYIGVVNSSLKLLHKDSQGIMLSLKVIPVTIALLITTTKSLCNFDDSIKPPFTDEMCEESGSNSIFALFSNEMKSDLDSAEDDITALLGDWADCMAEEYTSDICEDCDGLSLAGETPLDEAFFMLFDEIHALKDTVTMHCVDDHTLNYSANATATLKGVCTSPFASTKYVNLSIFVHIPSLCPGIGAHSNYVEGRDDARVQ